MMLYWQANFQIPNSGVQSAEVYVVAENTDEGVTANFYSDSTRQNLLFTKYYPKTTIDPYDYLLSLEEFSNYVRA